MLVYVVTVTDDNRSFMTGIFATDKLANAEQTRLLAINPIRVVNITETEVIGSNQSELTSSWEGYVDRQGGQFDDSELAESNTWR